MASLSTPLNSYEPSAPLGDLADLEELLRNLDLPETDASDDPPIPEGLMSTATPVVRSLRRRRTPDPSSPYSLRWVRWRAEKDAANPCKHDHWKEHGHDRWGRQKKRCANKTCGAVRTVIDSEAVGRTADDTARGLRDVGQVNH